MISYIDRYDVALVNKNPMVYFVFGDNSERRGQAGQAIIRYCPNAIGVATKFYPTMNDNAFFNDMIDESWQFVESDLKKVRAVLDAYSHVVFPKDGLGTGLAALPQKAPLLYQYICDTIKDFETLYGLADIDQILVRT